MDLMALNNENKNILTVKEISVKARPIFIKHGVNKVTLFGSYAKGEADEKSDIDLVVDTDLQGMDAIAILSDLIDVFPDKKIDFYAEYELIKGTILEKEIHERGKIIYEK